MNKELVSTLNHLPEACDALIVEFRQAVSAATYNLRRAGEIILHGNAHFQDFEAQLIEATRIDARSVRMLKAIAKGQLSPRLLTNDSPGFRALARLPVEDQERALANGVPLLVLQEGRAETLTLSPDKLDSEQVRQVFAHDHIRDDAEQRAWIESRRARLPAPMPVDTCYEVRGRRLVVMRPCTLDQRTLLQLAQELSK